MHTAEVWEVEVVAFHDYFIFLFFSYAYCVVSFREPKRINAGSQVRV
jgi:hypothetical protein